MCERSERSGIGERHVARDLLYSLVMSVAKSSFALVLVLGLVASTATATEEASIRVARETAPASIDARTRAAFRHAVTAGVAEARFSSDRVYTAYPAIVQLRRYVEPGEKSPTLVCVVSIAVSNEKSVLIASVRGSATSRNAAVNDVLEVASQSAVQNLVKALEANERTRNKSTPTGDKS